MGFGYMKPEKAIKCIQPPNSGVKSVEICVVYLSGSLTYFLSSLSLHHLLCVSLIMLKAIVALKASETLEERTDGVESHPAACGL